MSGIHLPDAVEQSRRLAQIAQDGRADVRRFGLLAALIGRREAQFRGPRHLGYGAYRIAAVQTGASGAFQQ